MKNTVFLFIAALFISPYHLSAQNKLLSAPEINIGISMRPEAFPLSSENMFHPEYGYQFKGLSYIHKPMLSADLQQRLNKKRWIIELSNYFGYDYIVTPVDSMNRPQKDLKGFRHDHFLDILYEFRFKKKEHSHIYIGAGAGYIGYGKKFSFIYKDYSSGQSGVFTPIQMRKNLRFFAPRLIVGYKRNNLNALVIIHGTPDEDLEPNPTLWIEYKLCYSIQIKKKIFGFL